MVSKYKWSYTTQLNFMAIVDAILPTSLIRCNSNLQFQYGGNDLSLWKYLLISFDNFTIPLSEQTSQLLDISAYYTIPTPYTYNGFFSTLSRDARLKTLTALENLQVPLDLLPIPYQNNPSLIKNIVDSFYLLTSFGYYSEWSGYLYTRGYSPSYRKLTCFPLGWVYAGYPGPSYGYRDFRGFLLKMEHLHKERNH